MNVKNVDNRYTYTKNRWQKKSTQHMRIYRHLDYFIEQAIKGRGKALFNLQQIREILFEETGFRFQVGTLKKYLKKCIEKYGESPLDELYRLNPNYYTKRKVKPPRNYLESES